MTTVTIKGFIHVTQSYAGTPQYAFWSADMSDHEWAGLCIGPTSFEYAIPDDFNPVAKEVESLEKRKAEALEAYHSTVREINDRLTKLQAIEFSPQ